MESVLGCPKVKNHLHFGMGLETQIGDKIRVLRRSKMPIMTIEDLAEKSGLTRQTVSAIENGKLPKVSVVTILKIAKALGVSITELTGENSEEVAESFGEYKAAESPEAQHDRLQEKISRIGQQRRKKKKESA